MNMESIHNLDETMLQNCFAAWIPVSANCDFLTLWDFHMHYLYEHRRKNQLHPQVDGEEFRIS